MRKLDFIQREIETERTKLNLLEQRHGVLHPNVIKQSMKLDELINVYNKMDCETKRENA